MPGVDHNKREEDFYIRTDRDDFESICSTCHDKLTKDEQDAWSFDMDVQNCPFDVDRTEFQCDECGAYSAHPANEPATCCNDLSREEKLDALESIWGGGRGRARHMLRCGSDMHLESCA